LLADYFERIVNCVCIVYSYTESLLALLSPAYYCDIVRFSGTDSAIVRCVCVCTITVERNDLSSKYSTRLFV